MIDSGRPRSRALVIAAVGFARLASRRTSRRSTASARSASIGRRWCCRPLTQRGLPVIAGLACGTEVVTRPVRGRSRRLSLTAE
jgi:hypothetical protein